MAKTALTVQQVVPAGVAPTYQAVDSVNGNKFVNDGITVLHIKNASASTITATVTSVADPYGRLGDVVLSVPAAGELVAGPFNAALFNQPITDAGSVYVTFSVSASVTCAVLSP